MSKTQHGTLFLHLDYTEDVDRAAAILAALLRQGLDVEARTDVITSKGGTTSSPGLVVDISTRL